MPYTEINHRKGLNYGGMPHDALLRKMEETNPAAVAAVSGRGCLAAMEDEYDDFARSEIVDWGPDSPWLESDQTRDNANQSRQKLNLRHNGTRGNYPDLPRHPEMFIGFTGDDPRGSDNTPRFDKMREQIVARAPGLTARMGRSSDDHIAERPWTGPSLQMARAEMQRRLRDNGHMRWFTTGKDGRQSHPAYVVRPHGEVDRRYAITEGGAEGLVPCRHYAPTVDADAPGPGRVDRLVSGGTRRSAGANRYDTDLATGTSAKARRTGVAATMAAAVALSGGQKRLARKDHYDSTLPVEAFYAPGGGLNSSRDVQAAAHAAVEDAVKAAEIGALGPDAVGGYGLGLRPSGDVSGLTGTGSHLDHEKSAHAVLHDIGSEMGRGLRPAGDASGLTGTGSHFAHEKSANAVLHDIASEMGRGLVDTSAQARRRVAGAIHSDGLRPGDRGTLSGNEAGRDASRALMPASAGSRAKTARAGITKLIGPSAADRATVNLGGLRPTKALRGTRGATEEPGARHYARNEDSGHSRQQGAPRRRGGAAEEHSHLGDTAEQTFGLDAYRERDTGIRGGRAVNLTAAGHGITEDSGSRGGSWADSSIGDSESL